ncbi:MAG: SHOCT domain-containing protein [Acidimicrobiales bacterium]
MPPYRFGPPGYGGGHPLFGLLVLIVVLAVVVWVVLTITRHSGHRHHPHPHHIEGAAPGERENSETAGALKILNERFARGEIDAEEFAQRRDLLLKSP